MNYLHTIPILALFGIAATGCYGTLQATPAAGAVVSTGVSADVDYEPTYYDDYVVYYDDGGLPYYYINGSVRYVPRTDTRFNVYVNHYRSHRVQYGRWSTGARREHVERREHWNRIRANMHRRAPHRR